MWCDIGWYVWNPHVNINIVMKRFHRQYFIQERGMWWQYPFCSLQDLGLYVQWVKNLGTKSTKKEELVGVRRSDPQTFLNNSYVFSLKIKMKNFNFIRNFFSYFFSFRWREIWILCWFLFFFSYLSHVSLFQAIVIRNLILISPSYSSIPMHPKLWSRNFKNNSLFCSSFQMHCS